MGLDLILEWVGLGVVVGGCCRVGSDMLPSIDLFFACVFLFLVLTKVKEFLHILDDFLLKSKI